MVHNNENMNIKIILLKENKFVSVIRCCMVHQLFEMPITGCLSRNQNKNQSGIKSLLYTNKVLNELMVDQYFKHGFIKYSIIVQCPKNNKNKVEN